MSNVWGKDVERERLFRPQQREGDCGHVHREDSGTNARTYGSLSKSQQTIFSFIDIPLMAGCIF